MAFNNDTSCKDVSRLCFMSWDPDLYRNPAAVPFPVPAMQVPTTQTNDYPRMCILPGDTCQRYADQAIATAIKILDASIVRSPTSNGPRARQRLKASRLL